MGIGHRPVELASRAARTPERIPAYVRDEFHRRFVSKRRARRLASSGGEGVAEIARAIAETLSNDLDPAEREWVRRLEGLREDLDADETELTMVDYGAGSPDTDRSAEEMAEGVATTTRVDELAKSDYRDCLLLFELVRSTEPTEVLELGTSVGMSAAYQAAALDCNGRGALTTIEGSRAVASIAERSLDAVGCEDVTVRVGPFQEVLPEVLDGTREFDAVFVDGHHDGDATVEYFERIEPHLSADAVLVFDDVHWSDDMDDAWARIRADDRTGATVDTGSAGICSLHERAEGDYRLVV